MEEEKTLKEEVEVQPSLEEVTFAPLDLIATDTVETALVPVTGAALPPDVLAGLICSLYASGVRVKKIAEQVSLSNSRVRDILKTVAALAYLAELAENQKAAVKGLVAQAVETAAQFLSTGSRGEKLRTMEVILRTLQATQSAGGVVNTGKRSTTEIARAILEGWSEQYGKTTITIESEAPVIPIEITGEETHERD